MERGAQFEEYGGLLHIGGKPTPFRKIVAEDGDRYETKTENGFRVMVHRDLDGDRDGGHMLSAEHEASSTLQYGHMPSWGKDSHSEDPLFTTIASHADAMDRLRRVSNLPGGSERQPRHPRMIA